MFRIVFLLTSKRKQKKYLGLVPVFVLLITIFLHSLFPNSISGVREDMAEAYVNLRYICELENRYYNKFYHYIELSPNPTNKQIEKNPSKYSYRNSDLPEWKEIGFEPDRVASFMEYPEYRFFSKNRKGFITTDGKIKNQYYVEVHNGNSIFIHDNFLAHAIILDNEGNPSGHYITDKSCYVKYLKEGQVEKLKFETANLK